MARDVFLICILPKSISCEGCGRETGGSLRWVRPSGTSGRKRGATQWVVLAVPKVDKLLFYNGSALISKTAARRHTLRSPHSPNSHPHVSLPDKKLKYGRRCSIVRISVDNHLRYRYPAWRPSDAIAPFSSSFVERAGFGRRSGLHGACHGGRRGQSLHHA